MKSFLTSVIAQFDYYRKLGEKTFDQLTDEQLFEKCNEHGNSIAMLVKHISGNMLSRWTDFLTTDGEKEWRNRDQEFNDDLRTRDEVMETWNRGWECLENTLNSLTEEDLENIIYIRNMGHTVVEAIHRQLAHYPYHIGQIVFIGKTLTSENWTSLSIAKGKSNTYNEEKFAKPKRREHFTKDL